MTDTNTASGAAIKRYKIGYHADEWGVRSSTPGGISDPSGQWVLYKDHIAALASAAPAEQPVYAHARNAIMDAAYDFRDAHISGCADKKRFAQAALECAVGQVMSTLTASNGQAPAGVALPEGWVPLVITHEGQYPEEIAYGPQRMMDRLDKWLRKYFDSVVAAAPTTQPAPQLPERDASVPAEQQGLFRKFDVRRVDGSDKPGGKHHGCTYFVLDVDHDPCARPALAAYAAACEATHPALAADLRTKWGAVPTTQTAPNEDEGISREQWIEQAMRVYLIAGDTEQQAEECAKYLWGELGLDDLADPYDAAMSDVEGRGPAPQPSPVAQGDALDAERLDWLRDNSCDLRCVDSATGQGDGDIHWIVIEHHMTAPVEREIGRAYRDDPRAAIDAARAAHQEGEAP